MDIKKKAYVKYQLDWMMQHGYSLADLMQELTQYQYDDPEDSDQISEPINSVFESWEENIGFGGEIWVCFDEFCDGEYEDAQYMKSLLTDEEFAAYLTDRNITHKAVNIQWDIDDEDYDDDEELDLPNEIYIPKDIDLEDNEAISDYLSELTGFCHAGFDLVERGKKVQ